MFPASSSSWISLDEPEAPPWTSTISALRILTCLAYSTIAAACETWQEMEDGSKRVVSDSKWLRVESEEEEIWSYWLQRLGKESGAACEATCSSRVAQDDLSFESCSLYSLRRTSWKMVWNVQLKQLSRRVKIISAYLLLCLSGFCLHFLNTCLRFPSYFKNYPSIGYFSPMSSILSTESAK